MLEGSKRDRVDSHGLSKRSGLVEFEGGRRGCVKAGFQRFWELISEDVNSLNINQCSRQSLVDLRIPCSLFLPSTLLPMPWFISL